MNINLVSNIEKATMRMNQNVAFGRKPRTDLNGDVFFTTKPVMDDKAEKAREKALKEAITTCKDALKQDETTKHQVVLDNRGRVLYSGKEGEIPRGLKLMNNLTFVSSKPKSSVLNANEALSFAMNHSLNKMVTVDEQGRHTSFEKNFTVDRTKSRTVGPMLQNTMQRVWVEELFGPESVEYHHNEENEVKIGGLESLKRQFPGLENKFSVPIKEQPRWNEALIKMEEIKGTPEYERIGQKVNAEFAKILNCSYSYSDEN